MSSNGFPRSASVFAAPEETIVRARRFCARRSQDIGWAEGDLRLVLLALGLDETAQFSEEVRVQDIPISFKWI